MKEGHRLDWARVRQQLEQADALSQDATIKSAETAKLFQHRAERLAQRASGALVQVEDADRRLLTFRLSEERYGIDLACVIEVFPLVDCSPIPGAQEHLLGVCNLRGAVRSVISLRSVLDLPAHADTAGYVLLVRWGSVQVGVLVDGVEDVEHADKSLIVAPNEECDAHQDRFVTGLTNRRTIVLDIGAILKAIAPAKAGTVPMDSTATAVRTHIDRTGNDL